MENTYGIGVANRYALFLDDESDPLETLSLKEQEKELKKKNKIAEKENKVKTEPAKGKPTNAQKKTAKETNHKAQENKRDDSKPTHQRSNADGKPERERNFNKFNNENREERNNRRNREDKPYNGPSENRDREDRPRREQFGDNFENRNRDRGERGERREPRAIGNKPGGPRGPRRAFDDRRGKREFDRQSGSDKTEADRPNNDVDQSWGEDVKPEIVEPEKKEETEVETAPVEEEPKELTLDEWKAQRAGRLKPQYNIRKAGEGEDPSQWKKMFELRKKEKEEVGESDEEEYDASEYPQRVGRQKHILDIDIQFNDNRRPGGGRGRGQRSGPRGNRTNQRGGGTRDGGERPERRYRGDEQGDDRNAENRKAPKVDDERDFPSLG
ncbi:plasminogen activator inhibitor 1 RNA-binding protein isoform X6 [Anoplophora glabripennis]|uniref:plasminogen activator inhibitor 1 RNA-binding protein isoform X6 n=1 Tax=Anoplophora glabripennis TaxID=217634 RepID=UPI0008752603|nr:plasminogen activator inhibitor 1 RNA-binding protein isoform X6 [Anoplophora glabripennis]